MRSRKTVIRPVLSLFLFVLFLSLAGLSSAGEEVLYASDFSAGMDGWYPVGAQNVFVTPEQTLAIHGRTESWNCAYRDLPLAPGAAYHISVEVFQETEASAPFMVSVAHTRSGESTTYENLAFGDAKKGKWTELVCDWTPGNYDTFSLYVETGVDYPNLDFEYRNFRVTSGVSVAGRFLQVYTEEFAAVADPAFELLKGLPIPDPLKTAEGGAESWIIQEELPVPVALKEYTLEDSVLSVTTEAKVQNIYVSEISPRGNVVYVDYNSQSDPKNRKPKQNATVTLTNPARNDVTVATAETKKIGKTSFSYGTNYTLNKETLELELAFTDYWHELRLKEFPPYHSMKKASAAYSVEFRADGTASTVDYGFEAQDMTSLQLRLILNESEKLDTLHISRSLYGNTLELYAEIDLDRSGKPVVIDLQSPSNFILTFKNTEEPSVISAVREAYPDASLSGPGTSFWSISLMFDNAWNELVFATTDELFILGEDGSLTLNTDAVGLDGKPFPWPEFARVLDPQAFTIPIFR